MSLQRVTGSDTISPEDFMANQARIEQARQKLAEMEQQNQLGLKKFTEQQAKEELIRRHKEELERKVQEGIEAQRLIQELERLQSTTFTQGSSSSGPDYGSARIEEVPHERQEQPQVLNGQSGIHNFPVMNTSNSHHQAQFQPPQWSTYHNTAQTLQNPALTAQHQYSNHGPQAQPYYAASALHQAYNYRAGYTLYAAPPVGTLFANQTGRQMSVQDTADNYRPYTSPINLVASNTGAPSYQHSNGQSIQPNTSTRGSTGNTSKRQAVIDTAQSASPLMPVGNDPKDRAVSIPTHNSSSRMSAQTVTVVAAKPTPATADTAQTRNSQTRGQFPYIDNLGVPFLDITPEAIGALRKHLENWILTARPGTRDRLHETMYVYKDTEPNPQTWIYVPWEPGSTRYARTNEIDKFFVALAQNAKLVALDSHKALDTRSPAITNPNPSSASLPTTTASGSHRGVHATKPTTQGLAVKDSHSGNSLAQVINAQSRQNAISASSATTSRNQTMVVPPAPVRSNATNNNHAAPSSSTRPSSEPHSTQPAVTTPVAQGGKRPEAVPSGLSQKLPLPSQVDKKHLTKHILFALGKRARPSFESVSPEQPAKRHEPNAPGTQQGGLAMTSPLTLDQGAKVASPVTQPPAAAYSVFSSIPVVKDDMPMVSSSVANTATSAATPSGSFLTAQPSQNSSNSLEKSTDVPRLPNALNSTHLSAVVAAASSSSSETSDDALKRRQPTPAIAATVPILTPIETSKFNQLVVQSHTRSDPATSSLPATATAPSAALATGSKPYESSAAVPAVQNKSTTAPANTALPMKDNLELTSNPQLSSLPTLSQFVLPMTTSPVVASTPDTLASNPYAHLLTLPVTGFPSIPSGSFKYDQLTQHNKPTHETQPLFLPSPTSSVIRSPEPGLPPTSQSAKKRGKARETLYCVLLPKASEAIRRHLRMQEAGSSDTEDKFQSLRTRSSSVATSVIREEELDYIASDAYMRDSSLDANERDALRLTYSRVQPLSCRWDGCNIVLNSVDKLVKHLRLHRPKPKTHNSYFTCRWTQCGRRCAFNDSHLDTHALQPIRCAYQGCIESVRTASQLVKHFNAKHSNGKLKPSVELSESNIAEPPSVPGVVPAYTFVTELVKPANISSSRHQVLCQLVVHNIVHSDQEKPIKRPKKTARPVLKPIVPGHNYEFIKARSTRYSSYLSREVDLHLGDLDSESVTKMIDEGLVLWAPEGDTTGAADEDHSAEARTPKISSPTLLPGAIKVETFDGATESNDMIPHRQEHSSDEDVVEDMLTEVTS